MGRIRFYFVLVAFCFVSLSYAQSVEINGKVIVDDDEIEGIHVINKSASKFTITQENGAFRILVNLNDTIIFSAIKYKPKEVIVNAEIFKTKILTVYLNELVNQLDEVIVGKVLTGNSLSDIESLDVKREINFFDLGIPGYTGKPLTLSENRYNEATTGGGIVPINPILNYLSGRTKQLKNQIKLERLSDCMDIIRGNLSILFFEANELDEAYREEFFFYCMEDDEFSIICLLKNDLRTLDFLKMKLENYQENLQIEKD